jgi:hypothetical protein
LVNRRTNRWTPAKGNAVFKWDPASRLTNIVCAVSPAIVAKYDALGRVTNLVDAVGIFSFRYSRLRALASEDGP